MQRKKFKLISCEVFTRTVSRIIADSPHTIDPVFTPKEAHEYPDYLQTLIQKEIEKADYAEEPNTYDAVLLCLGLCGNATSGVQAGKIPLIIPRAHDCCTIFLGSITNFKQHFEDNLSASWASPGYMERGSHSDRALMAPGEEKNTLEWQNLVNEYGEENAQYVWETIHPVIKQSEFCFINDNEYPRNNEFRQKAEQTSEEQQIKLKELEGNNRLITMLLKGDWPDKEFLKVRPGNKIQALYDMNTIMKEEEKSEK